MDSATPGKPLVQNDLRMRWQNGQQGLVALQEKVIVTLEECLSSNNDMVRLRTALSVFDRVSAMRQGPTTAESIRQMAMPIKFRKHGELSIFNL